MYRCLTRVVMKCSKLEQIIKYKGKYDISQKEFKQLVFDTREQFKQLNSEQLNCIIDLMRQDQLVDEENIQFLLPAIKQIPDESQRNNLLDKIVLPTVNLNDNQLKEIEEIVANSKNYPIAFSIYGKLVAFYDYQNKAIMNQFLKNFDISKTTADELGATSIGLALGQYREKSIWDEIAQHSLKIEKDFHSYMRIATGMGLTNNGNNIFWNDFIKEFRKQLQIMNEDIFTQSLQVISQQNIIQLDECESEIEYFIINSQIRLENMISIYVSMARKQLGSQQFYSKLEQDIYEMNIHGDDLILYVIELMQVKERIPNQTLNVLVAKAYSESQNEELIEKLSKMIN